LNIFNCKTSATVEIFYPKERIRIFERRKYICDTCRSFDIFLMLILFLLYSEAFIRHDGWSREY